MKTYKTLPLSLATVSDIGKELSRRQEKYILITGERGGPNKWKIEVHDDMEWLEILQGLTCLQNSLTEYLAHIQDQS